MHKTVKSLLINFGAEHCFLSYVLSHVTNNLTIICCTKIPTDFPYFMFIITFLFYYHQFHIEIILKTLNIVASLNSLIDSQSQNL